MRWVSDRLLEHCLGLPFGYKCGAIVWWSEFNTDKMIASSWNFFHPYLRLCCSSAKMVICQQLIGCIGYKCIFEVCLLFELFPRNRRSLDRSWNSGLSGLDLWTWSVWALPRPTLFYLGSLCLVLAFPSIIKLLKYFGPLGPLFWTFPAQSPNIFLCLHVWYDTLLSYEIKH